MDTAGEECTQRRAHVPPGTQGPWAGTAGPDPPPPTHRHAGSRKAEAAAFPSRPTGRPQRGWARGSWGASFRRRHCRASPGTSVAQDARWGRGGAGFRAYGVGMGARGWDFESPVL
ncbi:hypothetical protein MC885_013625 [Smutsia gigantea]|nr:hypothetical protein MC885_013625 [Smutsia gigantea]